MKPLAFFVLTLPYLIFRLLFYLYFWQLKEYRIYRVLEEIKRKGLGFFPKNFYWAIFLLLLFLWSKSFCEKLVFFSYLLFSFYTIFLFLKRKIFLPRFTIKIILHFGFLLFSTILIFFLCRNFLFFPLFDLFVFPFVIFSGILLEIPASLVKEFIKKKAKNKIKNFKHLLVVAITGSYGKTSTKEFLATILSEKFNVLKTEKHINVDIGIAQTILKKLSKEHQIFICEMGAYTRKEMEENLKLVQPKIAILTGVNEQHLALFGSMENLISAEGGKKLIESLPEDGIVIFNGENKILREMYQKTNINKKIIVGIGKKDFDLWAANIKVKKENLFFQIFSKDGDFGNFEVKLYGPQNIENILLAAACAKQLGMTLKEISIGVKKITPEQSGVKLIKTKDGLNIIDSTYSANPNSVLSHLEYLKVWEGKKLMVMPCLIELGPASKKVHQEIGKKIKEVCDLAIIVTKERFKEIKKEAGEKVILLENPVKVVKKIKEFCQKDDVVLLEGRVPRKICQLLYQN